jgi:hypothetical protein
LEDKSPRLPQEEADNLKRHVMRKEAELVIWKLPTKKSQAHLAT